MTFDERRVWYTRCPLPTASGLAVDSGLLRERLGEIGWHVDSVERAPQRSARDAHFTHAVPGLFRQGGNIPPIWARSNGAETALIGIAETPEFQAILARPETGIRDFGDLRGKRFGLPVRTSGEIDFWQAMCLRGLESALASAGLALTDVSLVRLETAERYIAAPATEAAGDASAWMWSGGARLRRQHVETFAFVRGEVDAIYTSGALGLQLQAQLGAVVVGELSGRADVRGQAIETNNQVPNILTVDRRLLEWHPDVVSQYVRALQQAADWAESHADAATRTAALEVGAPEEWIAPAYGSGLCTSFRLGLDDHLVRAVASQKDFLLRHGFITTDFAIENWIDAAPLIAASGRPA